MWSNLIFKWFYTKPESLELFVLKQFRISLKIMRLEFLYFNFLMNGKIENFRGERECIGLWVLQVYTRF